MKTLLFVALGGAVGASCRYRVGVFSTHFGNGQFPWGTFFFNVARSFALGVLAAVLTFSWSPSPEIRAFIVVGVLGGFTTFSTFSLDALLLFQQGHYNTALLYIGASVILCLIAAFVGIHAARLFF